MLIQDFFPIMFCRSKSFHSWENPIILLAKISPVFLAPWGLGGNVLPENGKTLQLGNQPDQKTAGIDREPDLINQTRNSCLVAEPLRRVARANAL
jgi:hypothetical protein